MKKITRIGAATALLTGLLLSAGIPAFGAANNQISEVEPNNDLDHATLLKEGQIGTGILEVGDIDIFKFEVIEDGLVTFSNGAIPMDRFYGYFDEQWGDTYWIEPGTYFVNFEASVSETNPQPYTFSYSFETWAQYIDKKLTEMEIALYEDGSNIDFYLFPWDMYVLRQHLNSHVTDGVEKERLLTKYAAVENLMYKTAPDPASLYNPMQHVLIKVIGETLYDTAVETSKMGWTSSNTVVIANGEDYALTDGLTATPLASANNAPLLLTTPQSLHPATAAEIKRLKAKNIILIGGHFVISPAIENSLKAQGYNVTRLGGWDLYETSLLVAKELDKIVDVSTVFMANGNGAPDALSIASQAGKIKQPIVLTEKAAVQAPTLNWLKSEQLSNAYFIGGEFVISQNVINQLNQITSQNVTSNRVSGYTMFDTNAAVIKKFFPEADLETILVAKSNILADALSAGPLAAKMGVPVLIASPSGLEPSQINVLLSKRSTTVTQIGGNQNPSVLDRVLRLTK